MSDSILYIVSRFPKVTETFVVNELLAVRRGFDVSLATLLETRESIVQPEAERLRTTVWTAPFVGMATVRAHLQWLVRDRRTYSRTLGRLVRDARRPSELVASLGVFLKAARLATMAEANGIGHVHAHFANHPATAAWIVSRLTGVPFSFTAHANDLYRRPAVIDHKLREAAFVVAVSEYNATLIRRRCPEARVHVVHCGVDVERFHPHLRAGAAAQILCVASLEPRKGHRFLLEAASGLLPRHPELHVVLIGDGPARPDIERLVDALGLSERIVLRGACTSDEVAAELESADVFVLASIRDPTGRMEGIPVALMEAMAAGVPVVATRLSGIPELVDADTGMLVEPNDSRALGDAIERLLDDGELARRCADRARARVVNRFDLFTEAQRLCDLFAGSFSHA